MEITSKAEVQTQLTNPSDGLWVVGDSVILGIRNELSNRRQVGLINAHVGRQAPELISVLNKDKSRMVGAPVIVNMGNNNRLAESEVVSIFEAVKDQPQIIVINTAVPRSWKDENNSLIAQVAANYQNVKIVDWNQISEGHPEYFAPDGVHLVPTGINVFVDAVVAELK
jgi:lysophospholipase L1-like esterase